jgi:hypothetical protein
VERIRVRGALAVVFVALLAAACTSGGQSTRSTTSPRQQPQPATNLGTLVADVTPPGWVAVDYGNAQVSVPADWAVADGPSCRDPGRPGTVFLGPIVKVMCQSVPSAWLASVPPFRRSR